MKGEAWALAAVTGLAALEPADRERAGRAEHGARCRLRGDCIEELQATAVQAASPSVDDDGASRRSRVLHLSRTSDMFGCDLSAGSRPGPMDPRPLFLEVKSSRGRQCSSAP